MVLQLFYVSLFYTTLHSLSPNVHLACFGTKQLSRIFVAAVQFHKLKDEFNPYAILFFCFFRSRDLVFASEISKHFDSLNRLPSQIETQLELELDFPVVASTLVGSCQYRHQKEHCARQSTVIPRQI